MANDKKFIVKNGLLTEEDVLIGSTTDTGERLQVTGSSKFSGTVEASQATLATATATFTNTGGTGGAVIAKFVGDSDSLQVLNVGTGDYKIRNQGQDNGLVFYDDTSGVEIVYNGSVDLDFNSSGIDFKREPTYNGYVFWNANNDGAGSGLDADVLDGLESTQFVRSDQSDTMDGDYIITGNLTVSGTTTYANTVNMLISDNIFTLNADYTSGTPSEDSGFDIRRGDQANSSLIWDETNDWFKLISAGTDLGRIITTADEGAGNGFDADSVDGLHAGQFLRADADDTANGEITFLEDITVGDGATGAQIIFDGSGQNRYVYANNGEIGFLNSALNYAAKSDANDNWIVTGKVYGTQFVDQDDNNFLLDPATTSYVNDISLDGEIIHTGDTDTYITFNANDEFNVYTGGSERLEINNTYAEFKYDVRADKFVDKDATGYYALPGGESIFHALGIDDQLFHNGDTDTHLSFADNQITLTTGGTGRLTITNTGATFNNNVYAPAYYDSDNNNYYGDFASTSQMAQIDIDTYIRHRGDVDTYIGFPGANIFRVFTSGTQRLNIDTDSADFAVNVYAPRYYDSNNTAYYGDFASTSQMNRIDIDDYIRHRGDTTTYFGFNQNLTYVVNTNGTNALTIDQNQVATFTSRVQIDTDPAATFGITEALRIDDGAGTNDRQLQFYELQNAGARSHRISFNTNTTGGSGYTYTQGNWGGSSTIEFANDGALKIYSNAQVAGGSSSTITPTEIANFDFNSVDFSQDVYAPSVYIDDYIIHDGDTNTYIGFDTTDRFGVWTAGTRRFYIDSTDADFATNVGIHKTTPSAALSVQVSGTLTANPYAAAAKFLDLGAGGTAHLVFRGTNSNDVWISSEGDDDIVFADSGANITLGLKTGSQEVVVGDQSGTYASTDATPNFLGSLNDNKLHVNGSVHLNGLKDALSIHAAVSGNTAITEATFLALNELGFSGGGGFYMDDATSVKIRGNKNLSTTGDMYAGRYYDDDNNAYYADPAGDSQFNTVDIDDYIRHRGDTTTYLGFDTNDSIAFVTNNTERFAIDNDSADFTVNVYAPRYYDSANNDYYTDPASTSQMNRIDIDDYIRHRGDLNTYFGFGANDTFRVWTGGTQRLNLDSDSADFAQNVYAPAYYDSNDNDYYLNPAATGISLNVAGDIIAGAGTLASPSFTFQSDTDSGMYNTTNYVGIGKNGNDEFRVYESYAWAQGSFRAPIFYDTNNTSYYADPASTSVFNTHRVNRLQIDGSEYFIDSPSGEYGSIRVEGDKTGSWAGYAIRDDWVMMSDGATNFGIYNDTRNEWALRAYDNAGVDLYYNGVKQAETEGGYFLATNAMRSPIYYAPSGTTYYLDLDVGNTTNALQVPGPLYRQNFDTTGDGATNYFLKSQDYSSWIWATGGSYNWGLFWAGNDNPAYSHFSTSNPNELVFVGGGNLRASIDLDNGKSYFSGEVSAPNFALYGGNENLSLSPQYTRGLADETIFDGTMYWEKRVTQVMRGNENNTTTTTAEYVKSSDAPGSSSYVLQTNQYRTFYSDYIEVEPGEELYGEMWVKLVSGSTDASNGGRFYYGIERFDKDKKPIAGNTGTTYFVSGGARPNDTSWTKYSAYTTIPTTHTVYNGSDGGGVRYVRIRILMNYSGGTSKTRAFTAPILKRVNTNSRLRVDTAVYSPIYYDIDDTNFYVNPASTSVMNTITADRVNMKDLGDYITFYGNDNTSHSITSRNAAGTATDSLRFNSYNAFIFNADSNNNNTNADAGIFLGQHGDGASAVANQWAFQARNDGITQASGSMRAPIFYDTDDTGYYLDPAATSRMEKIRFEGTDEAIELNSSNPYIRWMENGTDRFYIQWRGSQNAPLFRNQQSDGFEFMPDDTTGSVWLRFKGSDDDIWGYVYASDSEDIGFLDDQGSWAIRHNRDSWTYFYINGSLRSYVDTSSLQHVSSVRAPIFYDRDNTAYYGNFAGTSEMYTVKANDAFRSDRYEELGGGFLFRDGANTGPGRHLNLWDSTNDPSTADGAVSGISWGQRADSQPYYMIYTDRENYGGNYSKLRLNWHTGIQIGARSAYGGTRFYNDSRRGTGGGSEIFSVGRGDNNVRVENYIYAQRYYDSNNTSYYADPASTSVFNALSLGGYGQNNPQENQWYQTSTYAYSTGWSPRTQYYWIRVGRASGGGTKAIMEYYAKDDVNYSGNVVGRIVFSSWNNSTISVDHHTTGPSNSVTPAVRVDNDRYLWVRMSGNTWDSWLRWHWIRADGLSAHTGSFAKRLDGNDGPPPNSTNDIGPGYQYRGTQGSVAGGSGSTTRHYFGSITAGGDIRGTIFYDQDNTGYYTNPASTSRMNTVNADYYARPAHSRGHLVGSYNNIGANSNRTNPIYTIGSNYNPTDGNLENMYGIGYSHPNANYDGINNVLGGWGLYVAADGDARVGLDGSNGRVYATGDARIPRYYDYNNTTYYGDFASTSNINNLTVNGVAKFVGRTTDSGGSAGYITSGVVDDYLDNVAAEFHSGNDDPVTIYFRSGVNAPSDFGYITFDPDYNDSGEQAAMVIGVENDGTGSSDYIRLQGRVEVDSDNFSSDNSEIMRWRRSGTTYGIINTDYLYHSSDMRSPLFYDNDNTGYYGNFAATSRMNTNFVNYIRLNNGIRAESAPDYMQLYQDNAAYDYTASGGGNNAAGRAQIVSSGLAIVTGYNGGDNRPHTYDITASFNTGGKAFEISADWVSSTGTPLKVRSLRDCCQGWSPWVDIATSTRSFTNTVDLRAPIFYDSNNTAYYTNPASTSRMNVINANELQVSGYVVNSGVYSYSSPDNTDRWVTIAECASGRAFATFNVWDGTSSRHGSMQFNAGISYAGQGTITMLGKSWYSSYGIFDQIRIRASGTYDRMYLQVRVKDTGTIYYSMSNAFSSTNRWVIKNGTADSAPGDRNEAILNPNNGYSHGLHTSAGIRAESYIYTPSRMYSTIMYDVNDSNYYLNPNSISNLNTVYINRLRLDDGGSSGHLYTDDTYLDIMYGATGGGGIRLYDEDNDIQGYLYGAGTGEYGLLDNDGSWAVRIRTGNDPLQLRCNNNHELSVYTSYVRAHGSFRAPIFYDFNNTSYYTNQAGTSRVNTIQANDLQSSGNVTAYVDYSDIRYKEDVNIIDNAIEKVKSLDGITYKYIGDDKTYTGVIAQQVEKVLPGVVYEVEQAGKEEKRKAVNYGNIVGLLIESTKEQQETIEKQQKEIDSLKEMVYNLLEKLDK